MSSSKGLNYVNTLTVPLGGMLKQEIPPKAGLQSLTSCVSLITHIQAQKQLEMGHVCK